MSNHDWVSKWSGEQQLLRFAKDHSKIELATTVVKMLELVEWWEHQHVTLTGDPKKLAVMPVRDAKALVTNYISCDHVTGIEYHPVRDGKIYCERCGVVLFE